MDDETPGYSLDDRAEELLRDGKNDEYLRLARAAVEQSPRSADARLHYGMALQLAGQLVAASEELRDAVALAPNDPIIATHAAAQLFEMGHFDTAQEYVTHAGELVELDTFRLGSELVWVAGRLAAEQGDNDRARRLLQTAVDVGPLDRAHARFAKTLARFLAKTGNGDAAMDVVSKALEDHPEDVELQRMMEHPPTNG
jgi:tetratricopeptide (TPR) repeat protein